MRSDVAILALVTFAAVFALTIVIRGRSNIRLATLTAAGLICLGAFILFNLLDWPNTALTPFWTQHAIVAATASTLPLAGVGFFAFKLYDTSVQEELNSKVAATARSGLVDHLVDVDVALALLSWQAPEIWRRWPNSKDPNRPLRWLRDNRDQLGCDEAGQELSTDPRSRSVELQGPWTLTQHELLDQAIRRTMSGVKEWGPLLGQSRKGENDLIALGDIRLSLLRLASSQAKTADVVSLQQRCRRLAWEFEQSSQPTCHRNELIQAEPIKPTDVPTVASHWSRIARELRLGRSRGLRRRRSRALPARGPIATSGDTH